MEETRLLALRALEVGGRSQQARGKSMGHNRPLVLDSNFMKNTAHSKSGARKADVAQLTLADKRGRPHWLGHAKADRDCGSLKR